MASPGLLKRLVSAWNGQIEPLPQLESEITRLGLGDVNIYMNALLTAARSDLADLEFAHSRSAALSGVQLEKLSGQLGWTIDTLQRWNPKVDRPWIRLEAALITAACWDYVDDLWTNIAFYIPNDILSLGLEAVARSRELKITAAPNAPIWEVEQLGALQEAERNSDWIRLSEIVISFTKRVAPDVAVIQALRALAVLDWPRLIKFTNGITTWAHADTLVAALPLASAFRLAAATSSGHVRFAVLERGSMQPDNGSLSIDEENALKHLFATLAHDKSWPAWITIINKYPVRCPHMQASLGRALARSPENALRSYVDVVELSNTGSAGRSEIACCLEIFRCYASSKRRRILWQSAFERWSEWNFGTENGVKPRPCSELDFPIAGWLVEFEDQNIIRGELAAFEERFQRLTRRWYSSLSNLVADYNRLLARYQMFAFAQSRKEKNGDWLFDKEVFMPPWAEIEFVRSRFRTDRNGPDLGVLPKTGLIEE